MPELSRRRFIQAAALSPLVAYLPRGMMADALAAPAAHPFEFFTAHQADVVREATARLIPGPDDDPLEVGHPGAREANVVRYIDVLLSAFGVSPPRIHAAGPWSDRAGGTTNYLSGFVALSPTQERIWRERVTTLQETYASGIAALDKAAGGDFAKASADEQDSILANDAGDFLDVLFIHAVEGMYSIPEYGGNAGGVGWADIGWPGDSQPKGYTPEEVSSPDGLDVVVSDVVIAAAVANFDAAAAAMIRRRSQRA